MAVAPTEASEVVRFRRTVLIVDADLEELGQLRDFYAGLGCRVLAVGTVAEAIDLAARLPGEAVALVDPQLARERLLALVRQFHEANPGLHLALLPGDPSACEVGGVEAALSRPLRADDLVALLRRLQ